MCVSVLKCVSEEVRGGENVRECEEGELQQIVAG